MRQLAKLLVSSFAIAAIIVMQTPMRAAAQVAALLINSADEALISEFSAATKHHPTRRAKAHQARGGKSIKRGSRKTTKMGARHKSGKVATGMGTHKPGKVGSQFNKKGASKLGSGPGMLANGPGKMKNGPGKLGAGPAGAGTNRKVFRDTNMLPLDTTPSTQPAAASAKNKKNITEKEWIEKHGALMDRNLKKNPKQDPSNLSDRLTKELNKIYIRVDAPKDQSGKATQEKTLTPEERRAYGEAARKDHEETERLIAEQKARENNNPNAEKLRPSGITDKEHEELNQRSTRGKPNGTE